MATITPAKYNPLTMVAPKAPVKLLSKKKVDFSSITPKVGVIDPLAQAKVGTKATGSYNITPSIQKGAVAKSASDIGKTKEVFAQDMTSSLADFIATTEAKPEITPQEINEKFPEFRGKEQSLADFLATIEAKPEITQEEIQQKFPEIYDMSSKAPVEKKGNVAVNVGAGVLEGISSVGGAIGQGLAYLDPTMTVDEYKRGQENLDKSAPQKIKDIRSTGEYGIGKEVGKFAGQAALTYPIGGGAGKLGALAKTAIGAGAGAIQTQASNLINEGKFASASETAIGAGIGGLLGGGAGLLKKAGKSLYNSAFSQAGQGVKKDLAKYGQTAGEAVMEQGLPASVKGGIKVIKEKLGNTRKAIENTANTAGNIQGKSIREGMKQDIISKLGYNKLNQASKSTKSLIKNVGDIVDDMIPDGEITPIEVVQQIKQINSTLPNTLLSKGFQDLKGNSKIQKVISKGLKDALDKAVSEGGGEAGVINNLYAQYGKQKTVEKILEDESIRKILMRQLVGGGVGAGVGAVAGYEDIKQGDIIGGLSKVALFSAGGTAAAQLAKNPTFLMKLAKVAKGASKLENPLRLGSSTLSSKRE